MSEQLTPEGVQPEPVEIPPVEIPASPSAAPSPARLKWIAPAWFFFGVIVGIVSFATYNAILAKSIAQAPTPIAQAESVEPDAMRIAARNGTLDAIATIQAGGPGAAAQQQQGPQVAGENAFTVRVANRQGNPDAKVTIYEFSDFQ